MPVAPHQSCSGDPLQQLYREHHGWLLNWLRKRLGNGADAADLTQDSFLRLLVARPQSIDAPRAYLATVANRLLINFYRRKSLERAYLDALAELPEPAVPSLEQQALLLEALQEVDQVLQRLSAKAREAFLLSQLEGSTQEEIAQRLGVHVRSVQRYLAQAYEECIVIAGDLL